MEEEQKPENTTISVSHTYVLTEQDLEKLVTTKKIIVKTYVTVKDTPEIISNSGEIFIKQSNAQN